MSVRDWVRFKSLSSKMVALCLLPVALFVLFFAAYVLPTLRRTVMKERQASIRQVVDLAITMLEAQEAKAKAGGQPLEATRERAKEVIATLRYDKTNYLWVQSPGPRIVLHPLHPEWAGKATNDLGNPNLAKLFSRWRVPRLRLQQTRGPGSVPQDQLCAHLCALGLDPGYRHLRR